VLAEIGAAEVPQLMVLNKLDLTGLPPAVERDEYGRIRAFASAPVCGDGLPLLREALAEMALAKTWQVAGQPRAGSRRCAAQDVDLILIQMVPHDFKPWSVYVAQ
jgi:GTP-binding protein HflX